MKRLGVNIDHIATIRNARGEQHPDPFFAASQVVKMGADSVTIHLREDRRHINDADAKKICKLKKTSNTENGYTELFTANPVIKKKYIIPDIDFNFINDIKIDLDYTEDLELARRIFSELGNDFHMNDLLMYFSKNPDQVNQTKKIIKKWRKNYAGKTLEFRKKI